MWNGELDKKNREAGQAEQIQISVGAGRGVEDHRGMHGARLGITEKETGMREHSKELGEGWRRYGAAIAPIREAYGYWGSKWPRQAHWEGRISLVGAKCNNYGTGPTQRAQGMSWNREYLLKDPVQQRVGVDRACELLTSNSVMASMRSNFKC